MVTKLDIITNFYYCYLLTTFLLLYLRFVLPLRSSFTWGSQLIYYPPLEFTVNFRRGSHQSKSCCYVYPPHLLLFLLFNCLAKTLHGSKNSKWASNLPLEKILKSYQTIILLLINKKTTGKVNREAIEKAQIICKRHAHSIRFDDDDDEFSICKWLIRETS